MVRSRVVLASVAASVLVGCATLGEYRDNAVKTADVVRHVRCELREAVGRDMGPNNWLLTEKGKGWNVKLSFDLSVDHSGDISTGDNTWIFPMNPPGTFSLTFGAGLTGTGNRRENIEFDQSLRKLDGDKKLDCPDENLGRHAQLSGYLGIDDLIERASRSKDLVMQNADLSKLSYVIEFIVKKTANLAPKFNLIPIGEKKTFTGSAKWTGTRTDTQKLTLTFAPPADEKAEEICPVVPDGLEDWPKLVEPRRTCPTAFYEVKVKPACQILPQPTDCTARDDCALVTRGDSRVCLPACGMLTERKCKERTADGCSWKADRCVDTGALRPQAATRRRSEDRAPKPYRALSVPESSSPSGISPADRARLDNNTVRDLLQDIQRNQQRPSN
jgi:hypothetical protein